MRNVSKGLMEVNAATLLLGFVALFPKMIDLPPQQIIFGRCIVAFSAPSGYGIASTRDPSAARRYGLRGRIEGMAQRILFGKDFDPANIWAGPLWAVLEKSP